MDEAEILLIEVGKQHHVADAAAAAVRSPFPGRFGFDRDHGRWMWSKAGQRWILARAQTASPVMSILIATKTHFTAAFGQNGQKTCPKQACARLRG
jgi:hypothetical protein